MGSVLFITGIISIIAGLIVGNIEDPNAIIQSTSKYSIWGLWLVVWGVIVTIIGLLVN